MSPRTISFLFGVTYGIGLYIVADWLAFHRYDAVGGADRILEEEDSDAA